MPNIPVEVLNRVRAAGYHLEADDCTALLVAQIAPDEIKLSCSIPSDHQHVSELAADCERVLLKLGWTLSRNRYEPPRWTAGELLHLCKARPMLDSVTEDVRIPLVAAT